MVKEAVEAGADIIMLDNMDTGHFALRPYFGYLSEKFALCKRLS